ncbi:patatin-like phospholipase family protein [Aliarcobacter cryaerophilus]|uniref:patatin-like phospholipase family protein n=1 Tax=Aliarcobacter cryaerophilus TaxID=28198 RepID=UPI0021B621D5|nr:patatin-like phospholipase family protein [Aliarcobacter cryaerophilus]MCT7473536.1 patatin-like phospholipase family protein [Aliarcobacter cryaerophilus]
MKTKLGVVLSGGGAKGAYEAGFLKALSEFGIQPDAIAGTSIGALNGAIYSANKNTKGVSIFLEQIWQDLANTPALQPDKKKVFKNFVEVVTFFSPLAPVSKVARVVSYAISKGKDKEGILSTTPISNVLEQYASIEKILTGLPFYVGVTRSDGNAVDFLRLINLENTGLTDYLKIQSLNKDEIYKAILASAALPIAFDAQKINGIQYRDGCLGSLNNEWGNTPAKPLIEKENCTHLIVCHLNEGSFFDRNDPIFKDVAIIEIRPKNETFSSMLDPLRFSVDKIDIWMQQGYEDSKRILSESFQALDGKYERVKSEIQSDYAIERLKSKKFFIPDE